MRLGIFAKTFARPTLAALLDAVAAHGLTDVQFNLACVGLETVPHRVPPELALSIHEAFDARRMAMAALSGTVNLIHPDGPERRRGLDRLRTLIGAAPALGASIVTLCTGTRHPLHMWSPHPDNESPTAWQDLLAALDALLPTAQTNGIVLGIEPELANVVSSARRARHLLDTLRSPQLGIVMDAANLFPAGALSRQAEVLDEAFDLLGDAIVLAHAKDLTHDGEAGAAPAGQGLLDYDLYLRKLSEAGYQGPLILHGLEEGQVAEAVRFLRSRLDHAQREQSERGAEEP